MFRKVQLKFFGIITSILIAIFIGVLSSINIIMDVLMERQTKVVLQQVASGVEYNDSTSTFTFTNPERPNDDFFKKDDKFTPGNNKPGTSTSAVQPSVSPAVTTTAAEKTVTGTLTKAAEIPVTTAKTESEEKPQKTEVRKTVLAETKPPRETIHTEPVRETHPPFDWGEFDREKPTAADPDPWHDRDNGNRDDRGDRGDRSEWGGGFVPPFMEDNANGLSLTSFGGTFVPLLNANAVSEKIADLAEEKPPQPPMEDLGRERFGEPVPKSLGSIDFFVIMADKDGKYVASLNNDDITEETAQLYINNIMKDKDRSGMTGNLSFCAEQKNNGTIMVLTDRTAEMDMMKKLKRTTVLVGLVSVILLSAAAYFLSGLIVRPLKVTFEKQKQFISDASHELKTPLTVISANADVLSGEIGQNKWLKYIQDQADRMNVLVNELLNLTRLENANREFITTEFDLSKAVTNASLPFECQAFECGKNFVLNIEDNIRIVGSEQHIKQMTGIFIDNALKYSKDSGTVRVSLMKEDGKTVLSVYNTGNGVRADEVDKLFERFYRSDESRNRSTGGYGLGLAIAKSIIDKHKFKIQVDNQEGKSICFKVIM